MSGKTKDDFGHGHARFVTYMNVFSNPIATMDKTELVEIDHKQNEVQYGDIFFTTSSETPEEVGMSSVWLENKANVYLNSFCFGFRPMEQNNPYYMAYMLRAKSFRSKMILLAQGISRYNISKNSAMNIEIQLPKSKEQESIGKLFYEIDNLITLHQRKFNDILVYKLSTKFLFLKLAKNVWEQRKFENIFNYERPDKYIVNSTEYLEFGPTPVLTANKAFILGYTTEKNKYVNSHESIIFDDFTLDTKFVDFPYMVKSSAIKILTLKDEKKDNIRFNFELLSNHRFNMLGHARHYISVVQPEEVFTTNKQEQNKIGDLFTNIDNLITLHHRKYTYIFYSWEQRKLEEISNRFDNLRVPVSANEREKGTTPYYGANGIQDYVKGFTHNGEYVLIAEDGANDLKNYPVKYVNGLFWANNHVHVVQGKEGICDNKYLRYCFTKTNIESLLVGGGRAKLNANIMMSINLTVPSFNEQVELGRMFYELDNLITLHQHKELKRRNDNNEHLRW